MAKQERAERTRAAILDAAAKVFDDHGFNGATLSDILLHANVTKGALYFHFQSKEQIAHALIDEQFAVWQPLSDLPDIGLQTVIDLTHAMARRLQEDVRVRASIRLVIEQGTFADPAPKTYLQWINVVESCLVKAQAKGDLIDGLDANEVATYVIGSFTGVQVSSEVLAQRKDVTQRVTTMWRIILPGLVPPRRRARFSPEGLA
ncbi:ScbR family autoregulator-binding transcription factor [Saccharothrix coeruleofusca]|uniref:TetR family transcriptional regulator n=1 Tax=Saccharothrix coeruleofusca TaxID=33919 RepID=A0A918ATV3_9PSEU|nr:ScbR family autoregulator-binding transcription factor [Saccharothrix coeruleofusca]MBP2334792.1 AcrR family transcriptional regulator [Saccharothrix coeruleofusca]GGP74134.1 TetR family transcriptional regulator [Saccharothrix coeruleofusca]